MDHQFGGGLSGLNIFDITGTTSAVCDMIKQAGEVFYLVDLGEDLMSISSDPLAAMTLSCHLIGSAVEIQLQT